MSASKQQQIERLEKKIAQAEAEIAATQTVLDGYRAQLAALEGKAGRTKREPQVADEASGPSVVELLWEAALKISRLRSSRHKCRAAWARIPVAQRPDAQTAVAALKAWNRCEQWTQERNRYAKGLDKFITERLWEDVPENEGSGSRSGRAKKDEPVAGAPFATPEDMARFFAEGLKP